MNRLWPMLAAVAALSVGAACYQDEPLGGGGQNRIRVFLTDAPFPFDSVGSVNIYVVRIEATTSLDTSAGAGTEPWQTIVEPHRAFDLLALQQGLTAAVGEGTLSAGEYRAVRLVINVDSSSIKWLSGADAVVDWTGFTGPEARLYALVESPVDVPQEGADIVIDFDLGRSFLYNLYGTGEFTFQNWLRAVNAAATGAIAGTVTSDYTGTTQPIRNANVAVYDARYFSPYVVATGHTDDQGHYRIAFLPPGHTYEVEIQQPNYPFLARVVTGLLSVTVGGTTTVSVSLPDAGSGGAYIQIIGPATVGVGGTIALRVAVGDSAGNPTSPPVFTAATPDTGIVALVDSSYPDLVFVSGRSPGPARIIASSNGMSDTAYVQVVGALMPVDSVFVRPVTATFTVGDSAGFYAELYDSTGAALSYHPVSWFLVGDSSVLQTQAFGQSLLVRALKPGTVTVRAWSGEKFADAAVTVNP